jgi:Fic family protein
MLARAIQGSNSIEGYHVSLDDAVAVVESEQIDAETNTRLAVSGYRDALTYILQRSEDTSFDFNEELIKSLHYMMISHDPARHPGRWRPGPIYVRRQATGEIVYEGPAPEQVPALMREFVDSVQSADKTVPLLFHAAMAHLNLVLIHPFSDGNGRMARALQTLLLTRGQVTHAQFSSIEEYLGRNRESYYSILGQVGGGAWQPHQDARPWIQYCIHAHLEQAITMQRRIRETQRIWDELELLLQKNGLPERMIFALYDAAMGFRVKSARYRTNAEVSAQVASLDLRTLVKTGLLVSIGEKRGRTYQASETILAIRDRNREPKLKAEDLNRTG